MHDLSLSKTRTCIERLGDLHDEITRTCRMADVLAKSVGKSRAAEVSRLEACCEDLRKQQESVKDARECLLEFDGFLHAQSSAMKEALEHTPMATYFQQVGERLGGNMEHHVAELCEAVVQTLGRCKKCVEALRSAPEMDKAVGDAKACAKTISKLCGSAEKAISKGMQMASERAEGEEAEEVEVEVEVEEEPKTASHGYDLTAGELPPEFLENAKKKKEEAKAKKDDDKDDSDKKAADVTADSKTPGNESKGPADEGEEDQGWVPGHRTKDDDEDDSKKASHGYDLGA